MLKTGAFFLFEGLGTRSAHQIYREAEADARLAEELGFEGIHPAEHHFTAEYGIMPRTELFLARLSGFCNVKRLYPMVVVSPLANPIRIAEDIALLDNLFDGRIVYSVGSGYRDYEFHGFGVDLETNRERVREAAEIAVLAWTKDRFSYRGKHYQVPDISVHPKPLTKPHPPVWVSTTSDATIQWCAERGFTVIDAAAFGPVNLARTREIYLKASRRPADGVEFPFLKWIYVDKTDAKAREVAEKAYMQTAWAFFNGGMSLFEKLVQKMAKTEPQNFSKYGLDPATPDLSKVSFEMLSQEDACTVVAGSPDTVLRKLKKMKEAGGNYFIAGFSMGALTPDQVHSSMRLYAEHVMPNL